MKDDWWSGCVAVSVDSKAKPADGNGGEVLGKSARSLDMWGSCDTTSVIAS
jgi:hypothetical protein